jgi:hypothetical protein
MQKSERKLLIVRLILVQFKWYMSGEVIILESILKLYLRSYSECIEPIEPKYTRLERKIWLY